MNITFNYKENTITLYDRTVSQDTFRNFLIENYPLLVKKFITKCVDSRGVTTKVEGNVKTISRGGKMFIIDWEYIYTNCERTGYIMTDFIMYLKQTKQWNFGNSKTQ